MRNKYLFKCLQCVCSHIKWHYWYFNTDQSYQAVIGKWCLLFYQMTIVYFEMYFLNVLRVKLFSSTAFLKWKNAHAYKAWILAWILSNAFKHKHI